MSKLIELTGKTFGRLTVIKRVDDYISPKGYHTPQWLCKCECGNEVIVHACHLRSGHTVSCGCFNLEKASTMFKTHDLTHTRLYHTWSNMKTRCYNSNNKRYKDYGDRGISICKEWKEDFQNFYDWSMANGYKENLTIDRIDVNGNYEPSNCRWVEMKIQQRNKTNNKLITINGESRCLPEWCERFNIRYGKVKSRIYKCHWSPEKALTTP